MDFNSLRYGLLIGAVMSMLILEGGCSKDKEMTPQESYFHALIVSFVEATAARDSTRIASLVLDERAIKDAKMLQYDYPELLQSPERNVGHPYYTVVEGDTADVFLYARAKRRREFSTEFRRVGNRWLIVRIGFPPG